MDLNIQECQDLIEAILCEIDKHKHEQFHQYYLRRLQVLRGKLLNQIQIEEMVNNKSG